MNGLERISTGNAQLDEILGGGGFPKNSINLVMGEPGSGKTILAERLMFANAVEGDRPIVYLTTLSEPLEKVVRYLQQFTFFDESKLAGAIIYDSLGPDLAERGIQAVLPKLTDIIKTMKPKIIVVDSFKAIHDVATSMPDIRRMLYELAGLLTAYDTTAFLLGEYGEEHIPAFPEFAVADGIVQLAREGTGTRDDRYLRVLKLRGSAYAEGLHGFRIREDGLEVFPRLVSPGIAPDYDLVLQRVSTGVAGVDDILGGGLWRGSTCIVEGPSGSGKTTFGLQFAVAGARAGERALYVNFQENPAQLKRALRNLGFDAEAGDGGKLDLFYRSAVELQIDSIVVEIFRLVRDHDVKRVVVDAVGDLVGAARDIRRLHSYLYAFSQHMTVRGVTTVLVYETSSNLHVDERFSALCDATLELGVDVEHGMKRRFRVAKARGMSHELAPHELVISQKGLEVR